MSKKDKKHKKKHSADGSGKNDHIETMPTATTQPAVGPVPHDEQVAINKKTYEKELARLQVELIKLQEWIRHQRLKVVVIFEDAMQRAREAPSNGSPRASTRACAASWRCLRPQSVRRPNGTSNVTLPTCQPEARWCCSTGAGITAQMWIG